MTAKFVWTKELIDKLCSELASGKPMYKLAGTQGFPSEHTIYLEMARNEEFAEEIAKARKAQQDYEVDKCIEMADNATEADWQVVKLRIWARQWRASKLAPKKYGDRQIVQGDKDADPIQTQITNDAMGTISRIVADIADAKRLGSKQTATLAISSKTESDSTT